MLQKPEHILYLHTHLSTTKEIPSFFDKNNLEFARSVHNEEKIFRLVFLLEFLTKGEGFACHN